MKKLIYSISFIAIISTIIVSCVKENDAILNPVNSENNNENATYSSSRTSCAGQNYIFDLIKDNSVSDAELTKSILEVGLVCESVLKKLIKQNDRIINERDLKIILVYNSPLEDDILKEMIKQQNPTLSKKLIEKILAHNLPLSNHITNEVGNNRPDVSIPTPDIDFTTWFNQNNTRLNQVTLSEIQAFENRDTQRAIFNAIPNETKKAIWLEKMDQIITLSICDNNSKVNCVNQIKTVISNSDFTLDNNGLPKNHIQLESIKATTLSFFQGYNAAIILHELNDCIEPFARAYNTGGGFIVDCDCSTDSDWCSGIFDQIPGASCSGKCGSGTPSGCGTLLQYNCEKICVLAG